MKRPVLLFAFLTSVSLVFAQQQAQQPYQPAVPPPSIGGYGGGYGGYGGYGGGAGTTAAGSAMTGMANVVSAKGDYNLSTSAAAVNLTQAQSKEIENRQQYTDAYFDMRATNKAARKAERGPRLSAETLARLAHEQAPKPLSPGEVNTVTGQLNWPDALQLDSFAADRNRLEKLFGSYSQMGTLSYTDRIKARKIINDMAKQLKAHIKDIPGPDYVASKSFLESLMYTTCKTYLG